MENTYECQHIEYTYIHVFDHQNDEAYGHRVCEACCKTDVQIEAEEIAKREARNAMFAARLTGQLL